MLESSLAQHFAGNAADSQQQVGVEALRVFFKLTFRIEKSVS